MKLTPKADREFVVEYHHNGARWGMSIWADDWHDAERKLRSIGTNGKIVGTDPIEIKPLSWIARLLHAARRLRK